MAHQFKDMNKQEWTLTLTLQKIMEIEALDFSAVSDYTNIKLMPPQEDLFTHVITHGAISFAMIYQCCKEEAAQREMETEFDFAAIFDGPAIQEARVALWEELIPFFPEAATTLTALIEQYSRAQEMADQKMSEMMKEELTDEEMEKIVDKHLDNVRLEIQKEKARLTGQETLDQTTTKEA